MASPQLQLKRGQVQTTYGREEEHRQLASAPPCNSDCSLGAALGNGVQGLYANSGGLHLNQWEFHSDGCCLLMAQSPPWGGLGEVNALHSLKYVVNQLSAPLGCIHFLSRHWSPSQFPGLSQLPCSLVSQHWLTGVFPNPGPFQAPSAIGGALSLPPFFLDRVLLCRPG